MHSAQSSSSASVSEAKPTGIIEELKKAGISLGDISPVFEEVKCLAKNCNENGFGRTCFTCNNFACHNHELDVLRECNECNNLFCKECINTSTPMCCNECRDKVSSIKNEQKTSNKRKATTDAEGPLFLKHKKFDVNSPECTMCGSHDVHKRFCSACDSLLFYCTPCDDEDASCPGCDRFFCSRLECLQARNYVAIDNECTACGRKACDKCLKELVCGCSSMRAGTYRFLVCTDCLIIEEHKYRCVECKDLLCPQNCNVVKTKEAEDFPTEEDEDFAVICDDCLDEIRERGEEYFATPLCDEPHTTPHPSKRICVALKEKEV